MTDYTKLVNELRITEMICRDRMDGQVMLDAADAIEELQAEQKKTVTQIFGEEQMAWEGRCKDLMYWIADLQAQLPKRGEWVREMNVYDEPFYHCSACGECFDSNRDDIYGIFNYCPNCDGEDGGAG